MYTSDSNIAQPRVRMERSEEVASVSGRHSEMYLRITNGLIRICHVRLGPRTHLSTTGMPSMGQITPDSSRVG